jgi:hypothetical protein
MARKAGTIAATVWHALVLGALALGGCGHSKSPAGPAVEDAGREDASAGGGGGAGDAPAPADGVGSVGDASDAVVEVGDAPPGPQGADADADADQACVPTPVDADLPVDGDEGAPANDAALDARGGPVNLPDGGCARFAQMVHGECSCRNESIVCDQACTDVATDPDNCGACGRACAPSAMCAARACGAAATVVVPGHPGCFGLRLAAGGGVLYWTDWSRGTVNRLSASCGAQTLASNETNPSLLVVSGASLFWTAPSTASVGTIRKVSLAGGPAVDFVKETDLAGGIPGLVASDDGATLFYSAGSKIRGVPIAGGAPFDVAVEDGDDRPMALALSGTTIATVTAQGNLDAVTFRRVGVASCGGAANVSCLRLASAFPEAYTDGLFVRDGDVIWSSFAYVRSSPIDPAASQQPIAQTWMHHDVTSLAAGPGAVVFVGEDGFVEKTSTTSSATIATPIQRGQVKPASMVVLGASLYWSTDDCTINRAPL